MDKGIEALIAHMKWRIKDAAQDGHNMIGVKSDELAELIAALEQAQQRNGQLSAERDALRESGLNGQANTRAAADIYFQLIEECDIHPGGSLVEHIDGMRDRIAELEAAPNGMMQLSNELAEMKRKQKPAYDVTAFGQFSAWGMGGEMRTAITQFIFDGFDGDPANRKGEMVPKFMLQGIINSLQEHCDKMGDESMAVIMGVGYGHDEESI